MGPNLVRIRAPEVDRRSREIAGDRGGMSAPSRPPLVEIAARSRRDRGARLCVAAHHPLAERARRREARARHRDARAAGHVTRGGVERHHGGHVVAATHAASERVVERARGERNYHVLHQLVAGARKQKKGDAGLALAVGLGDRDRWMTRGAPPDSGGKDK